MANLRDLKSRITSIKNTKQITNAMKMVAAAKLRKTQDAVYNARPYAEHIDKMLRILQKKNNYTPHPLLIPINPDGKELLVIVTADRGLCGSFNSSIIRFAHSYLNDNPDCDLILIGRKAYDHFRKDKRYNIISHYVGLSDVKNVNDLRHIREEIISLYSSGKYSKVYVIYNEFKSAIQQNLIHKQIIPVVPFDSDEVSKVDYIYEPDEMSIIEELGTRYVSVDLWRIMLESNAAEQGARMTAMDNATTNAADLIDNLSLVYNRERQSQITTQIIEVASGAEAISN
ncbi:MAG: ATP synthase F1 subunit gamma [Candidatus Cloacimonetes bacterium]|jgi:F-type H+-transporting ATPase subunit gamma|nr:ATP synthase F1 subunit gamma [Candidatus Cloacimonadota bacterium]MDD4155126.1 ATP synthase F1 subunit gamma [Candidatus Cloacimonadota bacterium]